MFPFPQSTSTVKLYILWLYRYQYGHRRSCSSPKPLEILGRRYIVHLGSLVSHKKKNLKRCKCNDKTLKTRFPRGMHDH